MVPLWKRKILNRFSFFTFEISAETLAPLPPPFGAKSQIKSSFWRLSSHISLPFNDPFLLDWQICGDFLSLRKFVASVGDLLGGNLRSKKRRQEAESANWCVCGRGGGVKNWSWGKILVGESNLTFKLPHWKCCVGCFFYNSKNILQLCHGMVTCYDINLCHGVLSEVMISIVRAP